MKKHRSLVLVLTLLFALVLSLGVSAEYVACSDGTGDHDMSEWSLVATNPDGSTTLERSCSKCDYVQKGFQGSSGNGVATTRAEEIAVTLSADSVAAPPTVATPANPNTGARI